jgi:DNA-binding PadR family transcriptional regulator
VQGVFEFRRHDAAHLLDIFGIAKVRSRGSQTGLLARLLETGLIEDADGDERRRFYRISRAGRRALKTEGERLAGLVDLIRARRLLPGSRA